MAKGDTKMICFSGEYADCMQFLHTLENQLTNSQQTRQHLKIVWIKRLQLHGVVFHYYHRSPNEAILAALILQQYRL